MAAGVLPSHAEVVIVGGGVMGTSIAHQLALRGRRGVILLERYGICSGFTRHSTAVVRQHYSQELLVRMSAHGHRVFSAFEDAVGGRCGYMRTGLLVGVGASDVEALERNVALGQSLGVTTELLAPDDVARLDPRIETHGLGALCFEPEAGYCDSYLATAGFAAAAHRSGARIEETTEVLEVLPGAVEASAGRIDAEQVIVAAGPWSPALLAPLGYDLPLVSARAEVGRFRLPAEFDSPPPALADFSDLLFYFRPAEPGFLEVGSLDPRDADEPLDDPDLAPEGATESKLAAYHAALARRLPAAELGHWRGAWSSVYDVTPDWHPAIGPIPGVDQVYVAAGFSGHGFKLAPAVGLALAELVCDGQSSTFDIGLLAPDRFGRGDLVDAAYGYSVLS